MIFNTLCLSLLFSVCLGENGIVYTRINSKVKLVCEGDDFSWKFKANESSIEFNDIVVGEDIVEDENTLVLKSMKESELGVYACFDSDDNLIKQFDVVLAFRVKRLPVSVSVDVGESTKGHLKCESAADNNVIFRWFKRTEGDEEAALTPICGVENDNCLTAEEPQPEEVKDKKATTTAKPFMERISITTGEEEGYLTSTLTIDNAQYDDRDVYVCHLISAEHKDDLEYDCSADFCDETESLLRVKDPLAALWPFVGIVAEVVVLCLVIFICERRKKDEDKDDLDDDRYTGNNVSSNNSLRQRK